MIYVLGGQGFVGSAFVRWCESRRVDHVSVTRANYQSLRGSSCDLFINANGNSRKFLADRDPLADFDMNVRSALSTTRDFKFGKYVLISSIDVYDDVSDQTKTHEGAEIRPEALSAYGFSKYLTELVVRRHTRDWIIPRLGGMVGPGLKKNPVFDVVSGQKLWVDPASEFQFINTDEVARIVMELVATGRNKEVFNVCGDGDVTISDVMAWAGRSLPRDPGLPTLHYAVCVDKLRSLTSVPRTAAAVRAFVETWHA